MTKHIFISLLVLCFLGCSQKPDLLQHDSEHLQIQSINEKVFVHVSFLETRVFGKVKCNGAIFKDQNEVIIFDAPTNTRASRELIEWITQDLGCKIKGIIPTHFHEDCIGGLTTFEEHGAPVFASKHTIQLARLDTLLSQVTPFDSTLDMTIGDQQVSTFFPGSGHTLDNVVAYFPSEKALFGGCLLKSQGAGKGFLGDADTLAWSATIGNIATTYENIEVVIPGHGSPGDKTLLNYTAKLFELMESDAEKN